MLKEIMKAFEEAGDKSLIPWMSGYLKGQFKFFGLKSPERRNLSRIIYPSIKPLKKEEIIQLCTEMWNQPYRELHYFSQEILFRTLKKKWDREDIEFLEWLVLNNSWWDTVDFIAPKLLASYFRMYPEERETCIKKWIASENIWLMRSALLIQLKTKEETDFDLLFRVILQVNHTKEFFINKAIGWVLREHAKKNTELILDFVRANRNRLSNLSVREALKHFPNEI